MQPTTSTTSPHGRRALRLSIVAILSTLVLGACTADLRSAPWNVELPSPDTISELRAAADCDALVGAARPSLEGAIEAMWSPSSPTLTDDMASADRGAESTSGSAVAGGGFEPSSPPLTTIAPSNAPTAEQSSGTEAGPTVIGTNNQEQGVQESDLVATDGRRLVTVVNGMLRVVALDGSPAIDGTLDLSSRGATQMFLHDDTLLVLGTMYGGIAELAPVTTLAPPIGDRPIGDGPIGGDGIAGDGIAAPAPFTNTTSLTLVSIADPAAPVVTGAAEVEGSLVTARRLGERARVVVQGTPAGMEEMYQAVTEDDARAVVRGLDSDDLVPRVARDGELQPIGSCDDVLLMDSAPAPAPGDDWSAPTLSTVTVLTVGDDLGDLRPVSIQGSAETVYASTESLFIASAGWDQAGSRTDVHRFSLAGDGPATYTGSGRAPGRLLNQFSLSERDGALRLVTTLDGGQSSARLTVLDTDGTLDEIGRLDGMGIGEQVESVRFMDDVAYVVTFRQTDPLYAVSLSDPRNPALLGHLKIPGFSEYLHPIGDGLLLGVGRQVDPDTMVDEGLKISLFDVSDPATMTELDQLVLPGAWSEVGSDHLAFTWDPGRSQAVIPVESSGCGPNGDCTHSPSGAALVVHADRNGVAEVGRFSHEPAAGWQLQPTRSVVVGDDLWTVSIGAIGRTDANRPTSVELLRF
jgi:hypothetical protein